LNRADAKKVQTRNGAVFSAWLSRDEEAPPRRVPRRIVSQGSEGSELTEHNYDAHPADVQGSVNVLQAALVLEYSGCDDLGAEAAGPAHADSSQTAVDFGNADSALSVDPALVPNDPLTVMERLALDAEAVVQSLHQEWPATALSSEAPKKKRRREGRVDDDGALPVQEGE
jgi:hypothetical protein